MTSPFPFEVWHYAGVGENSTLVFVDTCGCGLYNYMIDPPDPRAHAPVMFPPTGAVWVSSGIMQANLISKPDPIYPEIAKAAHVQGAVLLHAIVSKTGAVEALNVISGAAMLQQSSMEAVRQWKYKPYLLNGEPVEVDTTVTVTYTIGN
jgi:TonB family protein